LAVALLATPSNGEGVVVALTIPTLIDVQKAMIAQFLFLTVQLFLGAMGQLRPRFLDQSEDELLATALATR
jgi:hypothetical protein